MIDERGVPVPTGSSSWQTKVCVRVGLPAYATDHVVVIGHTTSEMTTERLSFGTCLSMNQERLRVGDPKCTVLTAEQKVYIARGELGYRHCIGHF